MQIASTNKTPLVLDVDGTLLKTDMLLESFWRALGQAPIACLKHCFTHLNNRAKLKEGLAELAQLRTDLLPVNDEILECANAARAEGRKLVLASGSDQSLVQGLSEDLKLDAEVYASDGENNLTGRRKADKLVAEFGKAQFEYAGNSHVDKPIWDVSDRAIIVGRHPSIAKDLEKNGVQVKSIPQRWRKRDLLRALRPHQWVKNVLLFLPLISSHQFDLTFWLLALVAAGVFSAAASSIYIVNDLLDLEADRQHPTKRRRPFAAGSVPIAVGMVASVGLGVLALGVAAFVNMNLFWIAALYMALSLAYSLKLKRLRWIDIATLGALYTIRVIAGAIVVNAAATGFLVAFIYSTFVTLGCVKRLTELTLAKSDGTLPGREYARSDRGDLLNVAILGIAGSLLVFFLYSFSEAATLLYPTKWQLWLAMLPLAAWQIRMVYLGWKGKQDYDPIVFAMRDRYGLALIALMLTAMLTATIS